MASTLAAPAAQPDPHLGHARAAPTPGSPTSWTCPCARSRRSSATTSSSPRTASGRPARRRAEEIDLRAEDDALIAAELEAAESLEDEPDEDARRGSDEATIATRGRRRGRRGGRGRRGTAHARWRERSTTARRATGCGWTRRCRTTRCTPSTGRATGRSRSPSRRTDRDPPHRRRRLTVAQSGFRAPAAREVGGLAHIAREGGVGHGALIPRRRAVRRGADRQVQAPVGAQLVQRGQLGGGEPSAQPAAQLAHDALGDSLQHGAVGGVGAAQAPGPLLPLEDRRLQAHRAGG